jgi:hypothetical protein
MPPGIAARSRSFPSQKTKAIFDLGPLSKLVRLTGGTPPNLEMKTLSKALRHPHQIFFIFLAVAASGRALPAGRHMIGRRRPRRWLRHSLGAV